MPQFHLASGKSTADVCAGPFSCTQAHGICIKFWFLTNSRQGRSICAVTDQILKKCDNFMTLDACEKWLVIGAKCEWEDIHIDLFHRETLAIFFWFQSSKLDVLVLDSTHFKLCICCKNSCAGKLMPLHEIYRLRSVRLGLTETRCSPYLDMNWTRPELELQTIRPKLSTSRRQISVHVRRVPS